jgi:hypothetical protein
MIIKKISMDKGTMHFIAFNEEEYYLQNMQMIKREAIIAVPETINDTPGQKNDDPEGLSQISLDYNSLFVYYH